MTSKTQRNRPQKAPANRKELSPRAPQQPLVSGKWLLKTFLLVLVAAVVCAYLALCLLFWQGQWQLIYHPSAQISHRPGAKYDNIRFAYSETGDAQLSGWWIPAGEQSPYSSRTVLFLHGATGNLSDSVPELEALHALGPNVFAIDYRGYGRSAWHRPSEISVLADADSAIDYLVGTRHLQTASVVLYGVGLGATIAAETASRHPEMPIILRDPVPGALEQIDADRRTGIVPIRLLFRDRFDLAGPLAQVATPKLILLSEKPATSTQEAIDGAKAPQMPFWLHKPAWEDPQFSASLRRFLDEAPAAPVTQ